MTTERVALLALAALLALGCADTHATRRGDRVDVSSYPPDIQEAYAVFAVRCSRCHTLARPLNARISDPQHWIRYVARMRRQPGSGINHGNADIILKFLLYYHGERNAAAQPAEPEPSAPHAVPAEPPAPAPEPAAPPPPRELEPPPEPQAPPPDAPEPPDALAPPPGVDDTTGAVQDAPQGGNP